MGLILGKEGKLGALPPTTGGTSNYYPNIYVGLLQTLPADYDTLGLTALAGGGNEFTPSADFYTAGRLEVFMTSPLFDPVTGAIYQSNNAVLSWPNANADRTIAGVFITNVQVGTGGASLWVGPPDIGSLIIGAGSPCTIPVGGLVCSID